MRVCGGTYRGLNLVPFPGLDIRPTSDRAKISIFNILGDIQGLTCLDLFCGTGSLGIECLSRGASFVHFNDKSAQSIEVMKKNLKKLKCTNWSFTQTDYAVCLGRRKRYDIICIDPPYKEDIGIKSLEIIGRDRLLTDNGVAIFERDIPFDGHIDGLTLTDTRRYGKAHISFFELT